MCNIFVSFIIFSTFFLNLIIFQDSFFLKPNYLNIRAAQPLQAWVPALGQAPAGPGQARFFSRPSHWTSFMDN